jgi:hypothetical protein
MNVHGGRAPTSSGPFRMNGRIRADASGVTGRRTRNRETAVMALVARVAASSTVAPSGWREDVHDVSDRCRRHGRQWGDSTWNMPGLQRAVRRVVRRRDGTGYGRHLPMT